jgi:chromate transport protein ChrA
VIGGLVAGNRFGTATPTDLATVGFSRSVGHAFLFAYAAKVAGVFTLATSTIMRRASWPRWTSWSGPAAAAVLILSFAFYQPMVLLFAVWVAAISAYLLVTGGRWADGAASL